jgi:ethanolamine utilization protein EutN
MYLGRVIGTVVATRRIAGLEGRRFMVVDPVDSTGKPSGLPAEVAVDVAQSGQGDLVFLVGSREATLAVQPTFVPIDAAIVGIVDHLPERAP